MEEPTDLELAQLMKNVLAETMQKYVLVNDHLKEKIKAEIELAKAKFPSKNQ